MRQHGYAEHVEMVENSICPFCHKGINMHNFRNTISKREYEISGLCQKCQDKVFGVD